MKNNAREILKSKKGFSLMMVLCVMLLLLAISTSVLVAAASSTSSITDQMDYRQMNLCTDSIVKTITHSIKTETSTNANSPQYLGTMLLKDVYSKDETLNQKVKELNIAIPDLPTDIEVSPLTLDYIDIRIQHEDAVPADGTDARINGKATVNFTLTVDFIVEVNNKKAKTLLTYELTNATFDDAGDDKAKQDYIVTNRGDWRLVSVEKIDA